MDFSINQIITIMKKTTLLKTMLLLCALIVGSSSAWAANKWVKTAPTSLATGDVVVIVDQTTSKALPNTEVSKAPTATAVTLKSDKSEISSNVTSTLEWVVTVGSANNDRTYQFFAVSGSKTLYLCCKADNNGVQVATDIATGGTKTFTISQNSDNVDYLTGACTKSGSSENRYIGVYNDQDWRCYTSITANNIKNTVTTFYKKVASDPVNLTSFAFENTTDEVSLVKQNSKYEANYAQTVSFDPNTYDGTITYSIDYDDENTTLTNQEATINSETGEVTISLSTNKMGSVVVKANGAATSDFNAAEASYTLTIKKAVVKTPVFSPAAGAYYYGQIINVTAENAEYINYTDDGSDPDDGSAFFPDGGYELKGDVTLKVVAFDEDLNASAITSASYTLKAPEAPTFSPASGAVDKGTAVTLTVGEGGSTIIYTTDGSIPSFADGVGDIYTEPIIINYGQTIKAISVDGGENESTVAEAAYTLNVPKGGAYYTLVTDASQLVEGAKILIVDADNQYSMSTASDKNNRPAVAVTYDNVSERITIDETVQVIELEKAGTSQGNTKWYFKVGDNKYLYASSNSSNQLKTAGQSTVSDNGKAIITITNGIASIVFQGTNERNTIRYNSSSSLFSCYDPTNQQGDVKVFIEHNEVPTETQTVTSYGWATYIPSYAVEFPENRAYVVTAINGTSTTVAAVTKVPARTPVLLKGEGEVTATILDEVVDAPTTNLLSIGTGTTPSGKYPYVLAKNGEGKAGFKLWTGAASVLKDRVVMLLDETIGGESRSFLFLEDGETTGVADINRETITNNGSFFNLNGQRVAQPTKGLYIVNGKKVVVK